MFRWKKKVEEKQSTTDTPPKADITTSLQTLQDQLNTVKRNENERMKLVKELEHKAKEAALKVAKTGDKRPALLLLKKKKFASDQLRNTRLFRKSLENQIREYETFAEILKFPTEQIKNIDTTIEKLEASIAEAEADPAQTALSKAQIEEAEAELSELEAQSSAEAEIRDLEAQLAASTSDEEGAGTSGSAALEAELDALVAEDPSPQSTPASASCPCADMFGGKNKRKKNTKNKRKKNTKNKRKKYTKNKRKKNTKNKRKKNTKKKKSTKRKNVRNR